MSTGEIADTDNLWDESRDRRTHLYTYERGGGLTGGIYDEESEGYQEVF